MKNSAQYDPTTLSIVRGITPYQDFHEWAHVGQHFRRTACWRARDRLFHVPVLCRLATLAVEIEAALIARREMRECGVWSDGDGTEAAQGILSYVLALTVLSP